MCYRIFSARDQEGKTIPGAAGRLRDHENATKEAETDQKEKEKGSQRTAKVSDRIYGITTVFYRETRAAREMCVL